MSKRAIITTVAVVVGFIGIVFFGSNNNTPPDYSKYRISTIKELAEKHSLDGVNLDTILKANEDTGNLPDKIIGDPSKAKVVLYEYADYACSHCAEWSTTIDKMVDKSDGKLAVVYRNYLLPGFKNNVATASAATAAQIQGCWQEYKRLLFANQGVWAGLSGDELENELISCFETASGGKGDTEKFLADMRSEAVAKKVAFEHRLGNEIELKGTPTFRIDGENIAISDLKKTVEEKLSRV